MVDHFSECQTFSPYLGDDVHYTRFEIYSCFFEIDSYAHIREEQMTFVETFFSRVRDGYLSNQ